MSTIKDRISAPAARDATLHQQIWVLQGSIELTLGNVTGSDRLYARHGWQRCGEIPNYALWPDRRPCPTTIYFKFLRD